MKANFIIKLSVSVFVATLINSCSSNAVKDNGNKTDNQNIQLLAGVSSFNNNCCSSDTSSCCTLDLLKEFVEQAKQGKLKVYATPEDTIPMSTEDVNRYLGPPPADTLLVEDPENPSKMVMKVIEHKALDLSSGNASFYFVEDWKVNKESFRIEKVIKAVGLGETKYTEEGTPKGVRVYFYYKYPNS